jgi:uncharacterized protein (TIGR03905 family)
MKQLTYKTTGTCAKYINIVLDENNIITSVEFLGGCHGNTQGISKLVSGMNAVDIIKKLEGIRCGMKSTSCPDQLACALRELTD